MYVSKRAHTATSEGTFFCAYEKRLGESFYVARLSESCPWPEPPPLTAPNYRAPPLTENSDSNAFYLNQTHSEFSGRGGWGVRGKTLDLSTAGNITKAKSIYSSPQTDKPKYKLDAQASASIPLKTNALACDTSLYSPAFYPCCKTFNDTPSIISPAFFLNSNICGASKCACSAGSVSHFSITTTAFSSLH